MIAWTSANEANGIGWVSRCDQFAIRECRYEDGHKDYWPYYRPNPKHKFMTHHNGAVKTLEEAVKVLEDMQ